MSKPAAVMRQAKQADDLARSLRANPGEAARIAATANAASAAAAHDPTNVSPAPAAAPANIPEINIGAQPVAGPGPNAAPAAPEPENWEHKFKVLQGKYNAEVPRLVEALGETRSVVEQERAARAHLEQQLRTPPQPTQQPTRREDSFNLVSKDERESFGEDLIDVVGRRAQEVLSPQVQQLLNEVRELKTAVGSTMRTAAQTAQAEVYRMLNTRIPNWAEINQLPQFLAWLEVVDLFSSTSRRTALTNAFNSNDAPRVAGIFEAFLREDASTSTSRQPTVAAETLIAPGQPRGGSDEVAPGSTRGRIWSEQEIKDFYDRVRRKRVTDEEYQQVSAELARAAQEGRIRPDRMDSHSNQR